MIVLVVEGDHCVFPAESSLQRVCWDVHKDIPLAAPRHLQRLQQLLPRPLPLEEISPFRLWRRNDNNNNNNNNNNTNRDMRVSSFEKGDSHLYKNIWEPLDAGLSPTQMGLTDGSILFLSGDPFTLFTSGCVGIPRGLPYDSKRRSNSGSNIDPNTEISFKLFTEGDEKKNDKIKEDEEEEEEEEEEECPFWIPLLHSLLRWKLYNSINNNDLLLCGTSERRVVKIGKNGWINSLVGLPFSLGEWLELKRISAGGASLPVCERTVSWSVCVNVMRKRDVREIVNIMTVQTSHSKKLENSSDVNNNNNNNMKEDPLLEVSKYFRQAFSHARGSSLSLSSWNLKENNIGTRLLTRVVFPSRASLPSVDIDIPPKTSSVLLSSELVETVNEEVLKKEEEENEKEREDCGTLENETETSMNHDMIKVNEEEEMTVYEEEKEENNNNNNNNNNEEEDDDMRVPPCVLIGLASPLIIKEYLLYTESTNKDYQKPLDGYFMDPYTGIFFVNGVPSHMLFIHPIVSMLPSLPATITMKADLHQQVLNVIMDGEIVFAYPMSMCTAEEVLQMQPVVQIFSSGAVVDIH
ncbi:uncharacterized protein TM35_000021590 [Trypanosoma theileri]|uniref:Uncharacterized protein n=1 Tax=Trypanosoma theileri TaxID=67003 RepID=A0A1X0P884_9TRYP|nr:uncharacterized protein TM35_000021590 [Trypanosoma theileri]ORC92833.1 hypothetical protein TM35_000021590 [Trypanosoma theileri]